MYIDWDECMCMECIYSCHIFVWFASKNKGNFAKIFCTDLYYVTWCVGWIVKRTGRFLIGRSITSTTLNNESCCTTTWTRTTSRTWNVSTGATKLGTKVRHVAGWGYNGQKDDYADIESSDDEDTAYDQTTRVGRQVDTGPILDRVVSQLPYFFYIKLHTNTFCIWGLYFS